VGGEEKARERVKRNRRGKRRQKGAISSAAQTEQRRATEGLEEEQAVALERSMGKGIGMSSVGVFVFGCLCQRGARELA
jgi:hypothetical protein